jgi:regulatory protein
MEYAGRVLAARAQSIAELRTRLKRRAARVEDVDAVIAYLKASGYANDGRFAAAFAGWRLENQGFGKTRVLRDLAARRVAPDVAKAAVEATYKNADEGALIEAFLARKYRGKALGTLLGEPKQLASAYRKLRTAGFSGAASIRVLRRYSAGAEQLEEMAEGSEES